MNTMREKKKTLYAACGFMFLLFVLALSYRLVFGPILRLRLIAETGSSSVVAKKQINFGIDSFSGYAILRSSQFESELAAHDIKVNLLDDKADYETRFKAMQNKSLQMAVFTIDSLVKLSAEFKDMPASIVLVIDETKGADAIVAYKQAVKNLQDLNDSGSFFVLTPNSPSEFLARTAKASFNLSNMNKNFVEKESAEEVLRVLRKADKTQKVGYTLWEPYISQALNDDNVHVVFDSSKLNGYILDVVAVERNFLKEQPDVVRSFVESYLRVSHSISKQQDGFSGVILEDSKKQGSPLSKHQTQNLTKGLLFKNTLENYAHFGIVSAEESGGLPNMDRIISNVIGVLVQTGFMQEENYLVGKEKFFYYDGIFRSMQASRFRPDISSNNVLASATGNTDLDAVRGYKTLKPLTEEEWSKLVVVGEFQVEPITFGRGKSAVNEQAKRDLSNLANRLAAFPHYYLVVVGNARSDGDSGLALKLAQDRSEAVTKCLETLGVESARMKFIASQPSGNSSEAQTVTFVVGQLPY